MHLQVRLWSYGLSQRFFCVSCSSFRKWHNLSFHLSASPLTSDFLLVWCLNKTTFSTKIYLPVIFIMICFAVDVLRGLLFPRYFRLSISCLTLNDLLTLQSLRQSVTKEFCNTFSVRVFELYTASCKHLGANQGCFVLR